MCTPYFAWIVVHVDIVFKPVTSILAHSEYVYFHSDWGQLFGKLKWARTCALLAIWMYSFCFQLTTFHCFYVIESWASLFDKLPCALTSFDLSCILQLNMEWLMLQVPLAKWISRGIA